MRKLRNQDLYKVFNKATGDIKSSGSTKEDAKKQLRLLRSLEKKEKLTGGADEQPQIPQQPPQLQPLQDPLADVDFQAIGEAMLQQGLEQAQQQPAPVPPSPRSVADDRMKGGGAGASAQPNRLSRENLIDIIDRLNRNEIGRRERNELIRFIGRTPEQERTVFENHALSSLLLYSISRMLNTTRPETPETDPESEGEQEGGGAGASILQAQQKERDRRKREIQDEIERQEQFVRNIRERERRINDLNQQEASQARERELMELEDDLRRLVSRISSISSLGTFSSLEGDGYRMIGGMKRKAEQEAPRTPPRRRQPRMSEIYRIGDFLHTTPNINNQAVRRFIELLPTDEVDIESINSALDRYIEGLGSGQIRDMMRARLRAIYRNLDEGAETDAEGAGMYGAGLYADDMKGLIDASYDKRNYDVGDYKIDHDLSDHRVKVYSNPKTGKVVSVHRGSADWRDWLDNYKLVTRGEMKSSGTYREHKKKQDAINKKYGTENQILLGHSRAGKYVEELNKEKGKKYGEAITYNKATNWTDIGRKNPDNQTDVRVSNDPVSALRFLQRGKNTETVKNKGWNPFKAHGTSKLSSLGKKLIGKGFNPKKVRVKDMRDFLRDHHKVNGVRKAYGKVPKKQLVEEIKALEGGYCEMEGGRQEEEPVGRTEAQTITAVGTLLQDLNNDMPFITNEPAVHVPEYMDRLRELYDDALRHRGNRYVLDNYNRIANILTRWDMDAEYEMIDAPMEAGALDDDEVDDGKSLNPFFCRIGTKKTIKDEVLKEIPPHDKYVEPFVGGGAIFWNRPPSKKSVINDLDKCLIEGYRLLKSVSSDINKYPIPITEEEYAEARRVDYKSNPHLPIVKKLLNKFQAFVNSKGGSKEKQLLKILYKFCNTFGSKGSGKIFRVERGINKIKKIDEYKDRLKNTTIKSEDYKKVIKDEDGKNTFFFLDPPYESSKELYKEGALNLEELRKTVDGIKGKFLLTLNDSPTVRKAFKGYKIKKIKVAGGARGGGDRELGGIGQKERKEVFISNY